MRRPPELPSVYKAQSLLSNDAFVREKFPRDDHIIVWKRQFAFLESQ